MHRRDFLGLALSLNLLSCAHLRRGQVVPASSADRLGASTASLAGFSLLDAIVELKRLGFETIEMIAYTGARHSVGAIPGFDFFQASEREREMVYDATRDFRFISAHMPFQDIHLFSTEREVAESGFRTVRRALDGLAYLQGSVAVVHAGWPDQGQSFRDIWAPMIRTFRQLGDYAGERGITVGIETMQPNSVKDYTELVLEIDHPAVGATIDTGHIRGSSDIDLPQEVRSSPQGSARFNDVLNEIIEVLGGKVVHFHLSDVRGSDWADHRQIGTGIVDFPRLFATVDRIGYRGLYVFELEEPDVVRALVESKQYVEPMLPG